MNIKPGNAAWTIAMVSLIPFVTSLFMPALIFQKEPPVMGTTVLCWGWWGLLTGDFPWLANPAYLLALAFTIWRKFGAAQISALVAIGLGFLSLHVREWYFNEGGGTPVAGLGHAFYFWMGSFAVLFVGISIVKVGSKKGPMPPPLPSK